MFRPLRVLYTEIKRPVYVSRIFSNASEIKNELSTSDQSKYSHSALPKPPEEKYGAYEKRTIYGEEYPIWHKPLTERPDEFKSKFSFLSLENMDFTTLKPRDETIPWYERLRKRFEAHLEDFEIQDQIFDSTRFKVLGSDLAAAHFVCYRGGSVKLTHKDKWISKEKGKYGFEVELPNRYLPGVHVSAIDFENFKGIRYQGLDNIKCLDYLYWLSFKNCKRFDDWCMDKMSSIVGESVEYLDLTGTNVTHRGLNALYRFKNLKFLIVDFERNEKDNEMIDHTFSLLQEYHKDLLIKNMSPES